MATTHDHKHDTTPSEEGMGKTLLLQGAVLAGIVLLIVIVTFMF